MAFDRKGIRGLLGKIDMADQTPRRLEELPQDTRDWIADLRPDELQTLQAVVELPADDVRQAFKMVHDLQTVGRFTKWLVITFIGIFLGTVVLYENIIKVIGYIRGGPAH
jgi:hypothetical protein